MCLRFFQCWFKINSWINCLYLGHEQWSKISCQISPRSSYYLKDFKCVYYGCRGLPYGKENQILLINDEPSKTIQNLKWSGLFLESFKGELLSKNKVELLDLASHLWLVLIKLLLTNTIWDHYDVLVKYPNLHLSSCLQNYSWFMQYMNYDNGDPINGQPSLGMQSKSFHLFSFLIF
jgi:hypothetical protein